MITIIVTVAEPRNLNATIDILFGPLLTLLTSYPTKALSAEFSRMAMSYTIKQMFLRL